MPPRKTTPPKLTRKQREDAVFEGRMRGLTYAEIAADTGLHIVTCQRIVRRVIEQMDKRIDVNAEIVRQVELARLERITRPVYDQAAQGDHASIDRFLKLQERRAKYLGLDAPFEAAIKQQALHDLSKLTTEELVLYEQLLTKMEAKDARHEVEAELAPTEALREDETERDEQDPGGEDQ